MSGESPVTWIKWTPDHTTEFELHNAQEAPSNSKQQAQTVKKKAPAHIAHSLHF